MTTFVRSFPHLAARFIDAAEKQNNSFSTPSINVIENENEFLIQLAAPGLKKEDFEIKIHENVLTISASKKEVEKDTLINFSRKEFDFNSFKRAFTLPKTINGEGILANYLDGILLLSLPKLEEAKPKEPRAIEVV